MLNCMLICIQLICKSLIFGVLCIQDISDEEPGRPRKRNKCSICRSLQHNKKKCPNLHDPALRNNSNLLGGNINLNNVLNSNGSGQWATSSSSSSMLGSIGDSSGQQQGGIGGGGDAMANAEMMAMMAMAQQQQQQQQHINNQNQDLHRDYYQPLASLSSGIGMPQQSVLSSAASMEMMAQQQQMQMQHQMEHQQHQQQQQHLLQQHLQQQQQQMQHQQQHSGLNGNGEGIVNEASATHEAQVPVTEEPMTLARSLSLQEEQQPQEHQQQQQLQADQGHHQLDFVPQALEHQEQHQQAVEEEEEEPAPKKTRRDDQGEGNEEEATVSAEQL